jgi:hypothetical protein
MPPFPVLRDLWQRPWCGRNARSTPRSTAGTRRPQHHRTSRCSRCTSSASFACAESAPSWRAYGLGGNVHDPHDAILGAANYLAANHVATRERDALYRYNPSRLYVDAVARYTKRIAHDSHAFFRYYSWQVYFRTAGGYRRVTGPR